MLVRSKANDQAAILWVAELSAGLTLQSAMDNRHAQLSVIRADNEAGFLKTIGLMLVRLNGLFNVARPLTDQQILDLTIRIGKRYYYFKLTELLYVFEKALNGHYGKTFSSLDSATIMTWLDDYDVNERTLYVTAGVEAHKRDDSDVKLPLDDEGLADFYERVKTTKNAEPVPDPKRVSEQFAEQGKAFRQRYIAEKNAGTVTDYSKPTPPTEQ